MIEQKIKRHRRRKRRLRIMLAAIVLSIAVFAIMYFTIHLDNITVTGNEYLPESQIVQMLFSDKKDRLTFYTRGRELFLEHEEYPMLESYHMRFEGLHGVTVEVTEKALAAGISFVDTYLYLDSEGYLMYKSTQALDGIPIIHGIAFEQPVLYQLVKTEEENEEKFSDLLYTALLIQRYDLNAESLSCDERERIILGMGDIYVNLGFRENMEGKLEELLSMLYALDGLSGTLHLEDYSENGNSSGYTFVPR